MAGQGWVDGGAVEVQFGEVGIGDNGVPLLGDALESHERLHGEFREDFTEEITWERWLWRSVVLTRHQSFIWVLRFGG